MQTLCWTVALLALLISSAAALSPFSFIKSSLTWPEADKYCKDNGRGGLLSFDSCYQGYLVTSELAWVRGVREGDQIWVGGTNIGSSDGTFYFNNAVIAPGVEWAPGEPNNYGGNEKCLVAQMVSGKLRLQDYNCDQHRFWFMCN